MGRSMEPGAHRRLIYDCLYINMLTMLVSLLSVGSVAQRKAFPFCPFCQLSLFYLWEKAIIFSLVSGLLYVINFEDTDSISLSDKPGLYLIQFSA